MVLVPVVGNTATRNQDTGIVLLGANNTLVENTTTANGNFGILLVGTHSNILTANTVATNYRGIHLTASWNNRLAINTAYANCDAGITLSESSTGNMVAANAITANEVFGINLYNVARNTFTDNTVTGNGVGINLENASANAFSGTTVATNAHGIDLTNANANTFTNITVWNASDWAFASRSVATANTVANLTLGATTRVSFTGNDVALRAVSTPPRVPSGYATIGTFVNATSTGPHAWLHRTVHYADPAVTTVNVTERTLRLWQYNGTWARVSRSNTVDIDRNVVSTNITTFDATVFAPLGRVVSTHAKSRGNMNETVTTAVE